MFTVPTRRYIKRNNFQEFFYKLNINNHESAIKTHFVRNRVSDNYNLLAALSIDFLQILPRAYNTSRQPNKKLISSQFFRK